MSQKHIEHAFCLEADTRLSSHYRYIGKPLAEMVVVELIDVSVAHTTIRLQANTTSVKRLRDFLSELLETIENDKEKTNGN